jgi:hypothetical protein
MLKRRCEQVLQSLQRQHSLVYDIQGPGDSGVDVLVRLQDKSDHRYLGFQIKSAVEAVKGVYEKLKAQWVDAKSRYGERMLDYYVILCWDPVTRADRIRAVEESFSGIPEVKVIEPELATTFLTGLKVTQIAALATSILADDDPVLAEVRLTAARWSERQLALFVEIAAHQVEGLSPPLIGDLQLSSHISEAYERTQPLFWSYGITLPAGFVIPDDLPLGRGDPFDNLPDDLDALEDEIECQEDRCQLGSGQEAVLSFAYDARARFNLAGYELRAHLMELLTPTNGMSPVEKTAYLVESVPWLSEAEEIEVLAKLLEVNAADLELSLESDEEADWEQIAEQLRDEYRY